MTLRLLDRCVDFPIRTLDAGDVLLTEGERSSAI